MKDEIGLPLTEFNPPFDGDDEKYLTYVGKMRIIFELVCNGETSMQSTGFCSYFNSLLQQQSSNGSWQVKKDPIVPDEIFEYRTFPTIIAAATIASIREQEEDFFTTAQTAKNSFDAVLNFIAEDRLKGVGDDAFFQQIEAIFILEKGGLIEYLTNNRDYYQKVIEVLLELRDQWQQKLDNRDTVLPYGGDYCEIITAVVNTLHSL